MDINQLAATANVAPSLQPERKFLSTPQAKPDPASTLLLHVTETPENLPRFNTIANTTVKHVSISAMKLVFDADDDVNHLFDRYHLHAVPDAPFIKSMTWIADTIVIRSPLFLPGADVTVYARHLVFENNGSINTTPKSDPLIAGSYRTADPGEPGGNVKLNVGDISGTEQCRFILNGAAGQKPKPGKKGANGQSVKVWNGDIFQLTNLSNSFSPVVGGKINHASGFGKQADQTSFIVSDIGRVQVFVHYTNCWGINQGTVAEYCNGKPPQLPLYFRSYHPGVPQYPGNGQATKRPAGQPGKGGDAGEFLCNIPVPPAMISQQGGPPGEPAPPTPGGNPGKPVRTTVDTIYYKDNSIFERIVGSAVCRMIKRAHGDVHVTRPGPATPSPANVAGQSKTPQQPGGHLYAWMHPALYQTALNFIKQLYLHEYWDDALTYVRWYLVDGEPDETAWQTAVSGIKLQLSHLENQLVHNLDYFGNPAGWEPLLPLPIVMTIYNNEVCRALETWFLAEWLNNQEQLVENQAESVQSAMDKLHADISRETDAVNQAQPRLIELKRSIEEVQREHDRLQTEIEALQKQLREDATIDVYGKKICFFALHTASTVCSLIPWGQPALGIAGSGLELLTHIDPDNPPQSSGDIFALFKNFIGIVKEGPLSKQTKEAQGAIKDLAGTAMKITDKTQRQDVKKALFGAKGKLAAVNSKMTPFFKTFNNNLQQLKTPADEIEARLQQIEAKNPEYQELTTAIRAFNAKKQALIQAVDELQKVLGETLGRLSNHLHTSAALCDELDQTLGKLDHTTHRYIQSMAQAEQEKLNYYQYALVKSYLSQLIPQVEAAGAGYRSILDQASYQLTDVAKKLLSLAGQSKDGLMHIDPKKPAANPLYQVFTRIVGNITNHLVDDYLQNPIYKESKGFVTFYLDTDKVTLLNDADNNQGITINLMDMLEIPVNRERVRLVELNVDHIELEPSEATQGRVELAFIYMGEGTIRCGGKLYAIRHPLRADQSRDSRPYWSVTYDIAKNTLVSEGASSADKNFLKQFVDEPLDSIDELINYRPPAWGDFRVIRTDTGTDRPVNIKRLLMKFKLASALTNATAVNDKALHVLPKGDVAVPVHIDTRDLNGQADGWRKVFRMYREDTAVCIEVPSSYGKLTFSHYEDPYGHILSTNNRYTVDLSGDKQFFYVYQKGGGDTRKEQAQKTAEPAVE